MLAVKEILSGRFILRAEYLSAKLRQNRHADKVVFNDDRPQRALLRNVRNPRVGGHGVRIRCAARALMHPVFGKNRQLFGLARRIDRNFDGGIAYGYSVHLNALPFR